MDRTLVMVTPDQAANSGYLTGQLLIAMPAMLDSRFEKTVIYMCIHNADGAMGLVVNRRLDVLDFRDLLTQLDIIDPTASNDTIVHYGGPVETGRGFVLHSPEYFQDGTLAVADDIKLTATIDILRDMSRRRGPLKSILTMGYAGWGPGQLEGEIQQNAWLHVPCDESLLFDTPLEDKWEKAISKIGVDLSLLAGEHGHA